MASFTFLCSECGARYGEREVKYVCPACAAAQEHGGPIRGVLDVELDVLPLPLPEAPCNAPATLARILPISSAASLPPVPVGGTPLLPVPGLRRRLGMSDLWVKDDTRNPSGSTKDRASWLVAAKAVEYGYGTVACASTGNAATALACAAAALGLRAVVFVPAAAPPAKLVQIAAYGATLLPIDGSYDQAFELCAAACERFGWYNRNTAFNPFTVEGKKTAAVEIAAQLAPRRPDAVVVPVGDGVIVAGVVRGFAQTLVTPPRLLAVQPEGSSAIARALRSGAAAVTPVGGARSVADSLVVGAPRNARAALRAVRDSGGAGIVVSDDAIVEAIALLAASSGVFAEPAGAAALAGLLAARAEGLVGADECVVLMVTGSGLKDVAAAASAVMLPRPVAADLDAVAAALR
jgi:threonine synthase